MQNTCNDVTKMRRKSKLYMIKILWYHFYTLQFLFLLNFLVKRELGNLIFTVVLTRVSPPPQCFVF